MHLQIPATGRPNEQGFALISVIVVTMLIAVLASAMLVILRTTASDTANLASDAELRAVNEAGLHRVILAYTRPGDPLRPALVPDGRQVDWQFGSHVVKLSVQAESGKIDLNVGNRSQIAALAGRLIVDDAVRSQFLGALDTARQTGTRVVSIADLLPPFDRMSYQRDRLTDHMTVLTHQRGFDPRSATSLVLETSQDISPYDRMAIMTSRFAGSDSAVPPPITGSFSAEKPIYTMRAETIVSERSGAMRAVVEFSDRGKLTIYNWANVAIGPSN